MQNCRTIASSGQALLDIWYIPEKLVNPNLMVVHATPAERESIIRVTNTSPCSTSSNRLTIAAGRDTL